VTNHMWSGPSRALQFHLDLFERVDKAHHAFMNIPKGTPAETLPRQLLHRLRLTTAMTGLDGDSASYQRDDQDRMFDDDVLKRTFQTMTLERVALDQGETHYVSHSVMASIETAAKSMEPEPMFDTDMPCPSGVIVFEYPLMMPDLNPETGDDAPGLVIPVRAISWTPGNVMLKDGTLMEGVAYTVYTDTDAYKEFYLGSYRRTVGKDDIDIPALDANADELRAWLTDTSGWAFGIPWDDDKYGEQVGFIRRFLLAYWRWTWQRILVPTPYTPSRAERKWVSRIKPPLADGHIKVLRLRREIEHERRGDGEYQGMFDHQFIVRGFWRRQWYPSLGPAKIDGEFNPASHRLIYVEPFIKGNPNGPLIVGHNVTAAVR
jgi:hypothetical protein